MPRSIFQVRPAATPICPRALFSTAQPTTRETRHIHPLPVPQLAPLKLPQSIEIPLIHPLDTSAPPPLHALYFSLYTQGTQPAASTFLTLRCFPHPSIQPALLRLTPLLVCPRSTASLISCATVSRFLLSRLPRFQTTGCFPTRSPIFPQLTLTYMYDHLQMHTPQFPLPFAVQCHTSSFLSLFLFLIPHP